MAFGNLSQNDRFQKDQNSDTIDNGNKNLGDHEPKFKTLNQNQFGDQAPTMAELKANDQQDIKAPHDHYHNFNLKEALKVRSAFIIIGVWLFVRVLEHFLGHGDPNNWYSMAFNPNTMPGSLEVMHQGGGVMSYVAGVFQLVLGSVFGPLMFTNWLNFLVNVAFLLMLCWCAKFVIVDDMRIIKSYFLSAIASSFIVYGFFKIIVLSLTMTSANDSVWLQSIQQTTQGVFGLPIGLVGLWIFVLVQTMFERSKIASYREDKEAKKARKTRGIAMLITFIVGILYVLLMCRPTMYSDKLLKVFYVLLLIVSGIIGIIRGLVSYYTMASARQHGRL